MAKFNRRGKSRLYFLPSVSAAASPTTAEINAGLRLDTQVTAVDGFNFQGTRIAAPVLSDTFTAQITGEDTVGEPVLTFHDDDADDEIRTELVKGTEGYLLRAPYGIASAGLRCEVWHVETQSVSDEWTVANETAKFAIGFAVLDVPELNAVTPAP